MRRRRPPLIVVHLEALGLLRLAGESSRPVVDIRSYGTVALADQAVILKRAQRFVPLLVRAAREKDFANA